MIFRNQATQQKKTKSWMRWREKTMSWQKLQKKWQLKPKTSIKKTSRFCGFRLYHNLCFFLKLVIIMKQAKCWNLSIQNAFTKKWHSASMTFCSKNSKKLSLLICINKTTQKAQNITALRASLGKRKKELEAHKASAASKTEKFQQEIGDLKEQLEVKDCQVKELQERVEKTRELKYTEVSF